MNELMKNENINKKLLDYELNQIESIEIRDFTRTVLINVPDYFWDPNFKASSSGKYHLEINGEVESLIDHTKRVFRVAKIFIDNPLYSKFFQGEDDKDCLMSACLLHDSIKRGFDLTNLDHTKFEHPLYPTNLCKQIFDLDTLNKSFVVKILNLIERHSGPWNTSKRSDIVLPMPETFLELMCHTCDYIASRKGFYVFLDQNE